MEAWLRSIESSDGQMLHKCVELQSGHKPWSSDTQILKSHPIRQTCYLSFLWRWVSIISWEKVSQLFSARMLRDATCAHPLTWHFCLSHSETCLGPLEQKSAFACKEVTWDMKFQENSPHKCDIPVPHSLKCIGICNSLLMERCDQQGQEKEIRV